MVKKLLIVVLILILLFAGYLVFAFILHSINRLPSSTNSSGTMREAPQGSQGTIDQNIVGNWDTGCVVPEPKSPWAERHTFTINADGTATHKRYSGSTCKTMVNDLNDGLTLSFPGGNKVNISYTSGNSAGTTFSDIYQFSGNTLKFGHGFCNCVGNGKNGGSESDRFTQLNEFLIYKKQ